MSERTPAALHAFAIAVRSRLNAVAEATAARGTALDAWEAAILRHRRISLLHLRGVPWARIGEFVGQRSLSVTADTYTHVLTDEREIDYAALAALA